MRNPTPFENTILAAIEKRIRETFDDASSIDEEEERQMEEFMHCLDFPRLKSEVAQKLALQRYEEGFAATFKVLYRYKKHASRTPEEVAKDNGADFWFQFDFLPHASIARLAYAEGMNDGKITAHGFNYAGAKAGLSQD